MEAGFGRDLSDVRIHTDASAASAAALLQAAAFTTGRDIYFSESGFAPATYEGRHLLAHEIAHTIQQSDGLAVAARPRAHRSWSRRPTIRWKRRQIAPPRR
jgi:hypothetical protein